MGMFKRKKKDNGGGGNDSSTEFSNLETGEAETDDLLARLQQGMDGVQQHRERERQREQQREQEREVARKRKHDPCGCF